MDISYRTPAHSTSARVPTTCGASELARGARLESPYCLALLTHHQGVGSHVPEPLVLAGDQHCYEGNQVAEQSVHDAKQCPYGRTTKAGNLAVVLPYNLYPQHHLANRLP